MRFVAVPNVSEGRDAHLIADLVHACEPARVLDVHSDADHNRTVLTLVADDSDLVTAIGRLAVASLAIDMAAHRGVHPCLGGLDVCPIVPIDEPTPRLLAQAAAVARCSAARIAEEAGVPVYLYEAAATRGDTRSLPRLRAGGLQGAIERGLAGLRPDFGPRAIEAHHGVTCVGARGPLIAFNVMLDSPVEDARAIAGEIRSSAGGPPGIRALGVWLESRGCAQVSMNLVAPNETGVDRAFDAVASAAARRSAAIVSTELVGLPPKRFMPDPQSKAARLLIGPGRSLEQALDA